MNPRLYTAGALTLAAALLFAVNIISNQALTNWRLDFTQDRLYTLADGTRSILSKLEDPITLRLFLSQEQATRLPGIGSYAVRVRELLREYERVASGKLTIHVIDPEPFSVDEDRALAYGLRGIPLGAEGESFYFGLVGTNTLDDELTIPFLSIDREAFLEYDLTKLVYQLANPKLPTIGLLSSLPLDGAGPQAMMAGQPAEPWVIYDQLRQLFEIQKLSNDMESVPEDLDVLVVVHPKDLPQRVLYAIDQFVLGGGRALVFVDPFAEADQANPMGLPPGGSRSDIAPLLDTWGLALADDTVAADLRYAPRVRTERDGRVITVDYPVWMNLPPEGFNADDLVTADLGNVVLATAGVLERGERDGLQIVPLMETSEDATRVSPDSLGPGADPRDLLRNYERAGARLLLAARVTGKANSAFPDGPPEAAGGNDSSDSEQSEKVATEQSRQHLESAAETINVIVVADTDLLSDRFWVQTQNLLGSQILIPTASNGSFVTNAVENLAGSSDLISVRSRGRYVRPFDRVTEIRQAAEERFRQHEQELNQRLAETERRLLELEQGKGAGQEFTVTSEQEQEIVRFREEKVRIRKELRDVRHQLRGDIERLETWVKFINIGLVPVLIAAAGLGVAIWRSRRRREGYRQVSPSV